MRTGSIDLPLPTALGKYHAKMIQPNSRSCSLHVCRAFLAFAVLAATLSAADEPTTTLKLIPQPRSIRVAAGNLELGPKNRVVAGDPALLPLAKILAGEIQQTTGLAIAAGERDPVAGDVLLLVDPALKGEAYAIDVNQQAVVRGGNYDAVAAGTTTLLQAIQSGQGGAKIPRITVADEPVYPFRGALIDLARKYHSPGGIEQVVELCRFYKIRYLHVHISDDQLFMFPSTKFPQLGKGNQEFARFEPGSKPHIEPYRREELVALERYASERGVHIVPEMDLPGHSGRLVGDAPEVFSFPGNGSTVNIASPKTWEAVTVLLGEVMDVFASTPYVHLGADEVGLGGLENTPEYKAAQAKYGNIASSHDLYCKFIVDLCGVVTKRGKKPIVWEEAWNAGGAYTLPKDVLVMVWSQGRNPNEIVASGYEVVNATWTPLYIVRDNKKSLEFLFGWDPTKFGREGSTEFTLLADPSHLQGAQLCSWENSEAIEIQSLRDRLALVAERTWNRPAATDFAEFKERLAGTDARLEKLVHPVSIRGKARRKISSATKTRSPSRSRSRSWPTSRTRDCRSVIRSTIRSPIRAGSRTRGRSSSTIRPTCEPACSTARASSRATWSAVGFSAAWL